MESTPLHPSEATPPQTGLIACEVFRDELEHLGVSNCRFLEQGLHRDPRELNARLTRAIREMENRYRRLVLVYGCCGGGLENLSSPCTELVFPKVHDCIHLFLGIRPDCIGIDGKGEFYLTRGWIKYGKNPYTEYLELRERFDPELAYWSCKEMIKNYGRVVFIRTLPHTDPALLEESRGFARFFGMEHVEVQGNLWLLKDLIQGQPGDNIVRQEPDARITRDLFV